MSGWAPSREGMNSMNCEQFQEVLPQIIESGGNAEQEAHLSSCRSCSELVRDLKYIAEQAKLLLPMRDPNPRVWNNIQQSLQREGPAGEGTTPRARPQNPPHHNKKKKWPPARTAPPNTRRSGPGRSSGKLSPQRPRKSGNARSRRRAGK